MKLNILKLTVGILLLLAIIQLSACKKSNEDVVKIRINQFQNTTFLFSDAVYLQYSTQEGNNIGTENWSSIGTSIEGFNYEPGYIYDLLVIKYNIPNPPQDAPSVGYKLKNLISKTKAPLNSTFKINIQYKGIKNFIQGNPINGYKLLNQYKIDCGLLCNELEQVLTGPSAYVTGKFSLNADGSIKLVEIIK